MLLVLLAASDRITDDTQATAGPGFLIPVIVGVVVLLVLGALAMHFLVHKRAKASRGGVEPPRFERETRQAPPLESIERRS